jgi:hypothetical protein
MQVEMACPWVLLDLLPLANVEDSLQFSSSVIHPSWLVDVPSSCHWGLVAFLEIPFSSHAQGHPWVQILEIQDLQMQVQVLQGDMKEESHNQVPEDPQPHHQGP